MKLCYDAFVVTWHLDEFWHNLFPKTRVNDNGDPLYKDQDEFHLKGDSYYTYNLGHNILGLTDVLPNFPFTKSETNHDY